MTDLITRITEAMFRQEGMSKDYKNPGNLRGAPWIKNPVIEHGFWQPFTRVQGIAGTAHVVALHIAQGDSLRKFISGYAPSSDHNDTEAYIKHVAEWAAIPSVDTPLWMYIEDTPVIPT